MFCGLRKWAVLVFVFCTMVSLYKFTHPTPQVNDSVEYLQAANNLLKNNKLYSGSLDESLDFRLYTKRTLGYPVFLIFQNSNPYFIALSQLCLVVLNFLLGLFILVRIRENSKALTAFSIFYSLTSILFIHAMLVLTDLMLMTIVSVIILLILETRLKSKKSVLILSLLWSVGLALKPILLPSLFIIPILWYYLKKGKHSGSTYLSVPVLVWLLIGIVNYSNTGQFETSSISTINLTQYNAKLTIANKYGYDSAQKYVENEALFVPQNRQEYNTYRAEVRKLGVGTINDNLKSYLKVHCLGMIKMLVDPGRFELYTFFGESTSEVSLTEMLFDREWAEIAKRLRANSILMILFTIFLAINFMKLFGLLGLIKRFKLQYFLLAIPILYFVLVTGPVGAARFLLPATPLLLVLQGIGWSNFFQKRSKS